MLCLISGCSRGVTLPADQLPVPANYKPLRAQDIGARADASLAAPAVNPVPPAAAQLPAVAGARLTLTPAAIPGCDPQAKIIAVIRWHVDTPGTTAVLVEISDAGSTARKLFAQGGASGEATTGQWVGNGMQFHLRDASSGKDLATQVIGHAPCL